MTCFLKSCAVTRQVNARKVAASTRANRNLRDVIGAPRRDWLIRPLLQHDSEEQRRSVVITFGIAGNTKWQSVRFCGIDLRIAAGGIPCWFPVRDFRAGQS